MARSPPRVRSSDVEPKVDDVAVADDVVPALEQLLALLAQREIGARGEQVFDIAYLGADESLGEVGVDSSRGVDCEEPAATFPGPHLLHTGREEGDQVEQVVRALGE